MHDYTVTLADRRTPTTVSALYYVVEDDIVTFKNDEHEQVAAFNVRHFVCMTRADYQAAHSQASLACHCGSPVDRSEGRDRGMCTDCDDVRCDAYPGECDAWS